MRLRRLFVTFLASVLVTHLVYLLILAIQVGAPTHSTEWYHGMRMKKSQSALKISNPKLILVGGSSTHFSVQAEELGKSLGVSVANMGLALDLGMHVILSTAKRVAHRGDSLLLNLEYEMYYYDPYHPLSGTIDYVLSRDIQYFWDLNPLQQISWIYSVPYRRIWVGLKALNGKMDYGYPMLNEYSSKSVNTFGDETAYPLTQNAIDSMKTHASMQSPALVRGIGPKSPAWNYLETFLAECKRDGITVFATYPNLFKRPVYDVTADGMDRTLRQFFEENGAAVVGSVRESLYPKVEYFYDGMYHLNKRGRKIRTAQLAAQLKPHMMEAGRVRMANRQPQMD